MKYWAAPYLNTPYQQPSTSEPGGSVQGGPSALPSPALQSQYYPNPYPTNNHTNEYEPQFSSYSLEGTTAHNTTAQSSFGIPPPMQTYTPHHGISSQQPTYPYAANYPSISSGGPMQYSTLPTYNEGSTIEQFSYHPGTATPYNQNSLDPATRQLASQNFPASGSFVPTSEPSTFASTPNTFQNSSQFLGLETEGRDRKLSARDPSGRVPEISYPNHTTSPSPFYAPPGPRGGADVYEGGGRWDSDPYRNPTAIANTAPETHPQRHLVGRGQLGPGGGGGQEYGTSGGTGGNGNGYPAIARWGGGRPSLPPQHLLAPQPVTPYSRPRFPYTPAPSRKVPALTCTVCDIECTGKAVMAQHLAGRKHIRMAEKGGGMREGGQKRKGVSHEGGLEEGKKKKKKGEIGGEGAADIQSRVVVVKVGLGASPTVMKGKEDGGDLGEGQKGVDLGATTPGSGQLFMITSEGMQLGGEGVAVESKEERTVVVPLAGGEHGAGEGGMDVSRGKKGALAIRPMLSSHSIDFELIEVCIAGDGDTVEDGEGGWYWKGDLPKERSREGRRGLGGEGGAGVGQAVKGRGEAEVVTSLAGCEPMVVGDAVG